MKKNLYFLLIIFAICFVLLIYYYRGTSNDIIGGDEAQRLPTGPLRGIRHSFCLLHGFYPNKMSVLLYGTEKECFGDFEANFHLEQNGKKIISKQSQQACFIKYATVNAYLYIWTKENDIYIESPDGLVRVINNTTYMPKTVINLNTDKKTRLKNTLSKIKKNTDKEKLIKSEESAKNEIKRILMRKIEHNKPYGHIVASFKSIVHQEYKDLASLLDPYYQRHPASLVKMWAAWAYIKLNCKNKLPLLIERYEQEKNTIVKLLTVRGILAFGGKLLPEYNMYVRQFIGKGTWEEKVFAVEALAAMGEGSFEVLVKCLQDKEPDVRTAAMLALVKIAPKKSLKSLYEAYQSEKEIDMKYNVWYCLTLCLDPKRKVLTLKHFADDEKNVSAALKKMIQAATK